MIVVTVAALSLDEELSVGAGASELESVGALSELESVGADSSLLDSVAAGSVYEGSWDDEDSVGAGSEADSLEDSVGEGTGASVPTTVASGKSVVVE
jgi:hypothetical protein